MIIDKVAVTYDSFEELMHRRIVIENTATDYISKNPIADRIESVVRISDTGKFILEVNLIGN